MIWAICEIVGTVFLVGFIFFLLFCFFQLCNQVARIHDKLFEGEEDLKEENPIDKKSH
jgi:hypothetical protein